MVQKWQLRSLHPKALSTMCHTLLKYSKDPLLQIADWGDLGLVKQELAHLLCLQHPREITDRMLETMLLNCMHDHLHGRDPAIKPYGDYLMFKFEHRRTFVEAWFEYRQRTLRFSRWRRHQHNPSDLQERAASSDTRSSKGSKGSSSTATTTSLGHDWRNADIRSRRPDMRSSSDEPRRKRERSQPSPTRIMEQQQALSPSTERVGAKPLNRGSPQTVAAEFPAQPHCSSPRTMAKHRLLKFIRTATSNISDYHCDDEPQSLINSLHDNDCGAEGSELGELTAAIQQENPKRRRLEDAPAKDALPAMLQTPPPQEQRSRPLSASASDSTDRELSSSDNPPAQPPQPTLYFHNERDGQDNMQDDHVAAELLRERHALVLRICDKLRELQAHRRDSPLVIDLTVD